MLGQTVCTLCQTRKSVILFSCILCKIKINSHVQIIFQIWFIFNFMQLRIFSYQYVKIAKILIAVWRFTPFFLCFSKTVSVALRSLFFTLLLRPRCFGEQDHDVFLTFFFCSIKRQDSSLEVLCFFPYGLVINKTILNKLNHIDTFVADSQNLMAKEMYCWFISSVELWAIPIPMHQHRHKQSTLPNRNAPNDKNDDNIAYFFFGFFQHLRV